MSNNTQLPATFQKELDDLIMKHTLELRNDNDYQIGYEKGMEKGIEIGATEYATRLHEAQQLIDRLGIALENIHNIHSKQWSEFDRNEIKGILQQWKEGKEVQNG